VIRGSVTGNTMERLQRTEALKEGSLSSSGLKRTALEACLHCTALETCLHCTALETCLHCTALETRLESLVSEEIVKHHSHGSPTATCRAWHEGFS